MNTAAVESTTAGEIRRLVVLAWPVSLGHLGMLVMSLVDVAMVGQLGGEALAAVALGHTWSWGALIFGLGVTMGIDPIVAQAFGCKNEPETVRALARGFVVTTAIAFPIIGIHFVAEPMLMMLGEPVHLLGTASAYAMWMGASVLPFLWFSLLRQFLQAKADMRPAMWAIVGANIVNVIANWMLIYGGAGAPEMGPVGSAVATLFARMVMLLGLVIYVRHELRAVWGERGALFSYRPLAYMIAIAVPVGVQTALESWAFTSVTLFMGWIGEAAVAAHTVAITLCAFFFMIPLGISAAGATRVGNLIGAGHGWRRAAWTTVLLSMGSMLFSIALFTFFPELLGSLLTPDPEVIAVVGVLLPIAAGFQLFDGIQVGAFGVLRGAGDTRVPTLANLVGFWMIGLPIGVWLAFRADWGAVGLWTGLTVGLIVVSVLLVLRLYWQLNREEQHGVGLAP